MIIKVKKVYYCEYCKKHSLRPMTKHEKHCTMNPDRECRMCGAGSISDLIVKWRLKNIVPVYVSEFPDGIDITDIINDVDSCPNCTLAIVRQVIGKGNMWLIRDFDYKKMLSDWWEERNAERIEDYSYL